MAYKRYVLIAAILILSAAVVFIVLPQKAAGPNIDEQERAFPVGENLDPAVPPGYSLDNYTVAEVSTATCQVNSDCVTPANYLIRSNCPYTSLCLKNRCTVVCPLHEKSP